MKAKRVELRADIDIKALTCDPAAGRAYRKLVEAGAKAAALEQGVGMVVLTYKLPRSFDALAVPGMTRKKVGRVSQRTPFGCA